MLASWFTEALARSSTYPFVQGLLAALGTFVLEDPTTVACGLLVADRRMAYLAALIGVSAGIAIGDIGLYYVGRQLGPAAIRRGFISGGSLDRVAHWFRRNMVLALVVSRFVPGTRLPTFIGAGILHAPAGRFIGIAVGASLAWTFLLLRATIMLGETFLPMLGRMRWLVAAAALTALVLLQRGVARRLEGLPAAGATAARDVSRFEFWPAWLFYIPVGIYYAWLALRYRGTTLPTVANPSIYSGGLIGESKSQILDLVGVPQRRWIACYAVFDRPADGTALPPMLRMARRAIDDAGLAFPLVAKPDVGQRGAGVQLLRSDADLQRYLEGFPAGRRIVFQRLAGRAGMEHGANAHDATRWSGVGEAGVLYWRLPGSAAGQIFSITLKQSPVLTGDGIRTLRSLIEHDSRARKIREVYFRRFAGELDRVPALDERLPLVFAGNHCQGAVFRDGTDLCTPALLQRVHEIAAAMPEFYFGRFDIRFDDVEAFLRGDDLQIIEVNGAGSEATHIWDASMGLSRAYGTLFEQFSILFRIGAANRARGHLPLGPIAVLRDALAYRRLARSYPGTH